MEESNSAKAARLVSEVLLGTKEKKITVNGKEYILKPPTIHQLAGAAHYLSDLEGGETFEDTVRQMKSLQSACVALSYFIQDDESLAEELSRGTLTEVVHGLSEAIKLLSIQDFFLLSTLVRSVEKMAANPLP